MYFAIFEVVPEVVTPNRLAVYAAAPVRDAKAIPNIWDKEETDPIINSGEGIATAELAGNIKKANEIAMPDVYFDSAKCNKVKNFLFHRPLKNLTTRPTMELIYF